MSGETVSTLDRSTLPDIVWTPRRVCVDREGVVPASVKRLLKLERPYEDLHGETGLEVYDARRKARKWVLVASFGHLGYRNSPSGLHLSSRSSYEHWQVLND